MIAIDEFESAQIRGLITARLRLLRDGMKSMPTGELNYARALVYINESRNLHRLGNKLRTRARREHNAPPTIPVSRL